MSGVGGVSGAGGAASTYGSSPAGGSAGSKAVTPAKGAGGVSDDGGKAGIEVAGDNNLVGNTQTQNINITNNNYDMSTHDFCSMRSVGESSEVSPMSKDGQIDMEQLMKLVMMMMIMKMLEAVMNNSDSGGGGLAAAGGGGGGGQAGFSAIM